MSAHYWTPPSNFSGNFDGNCFQILNLQVDTNIKCVGFIGSTIGVGTRVTRLTLNKASIKTSDYICFAGGIVGYLNSSSVEKCSVINSSVIASSSESSSRFVGGIAGYSDSSAKIMECGVENNDILNYYSVAGNSYYVGGITAFLASGSISNCLSVGNTIDAYEISSTSITSKSYYMQTTNHRVVFGHWIKCNVGYKTLRTKYEYAGGLVGYRNGGTITYSISSGNSIYGNFGTKEERVWYVSSHEAYLSLASDIPSKSELFTSDTEVTEDRYNTKLKEWELLKNSNEYTSHSSVPSTYANSETYAYNFTNNNCTTSYGSSIPSGFSSTYWSVKSYINNGKVHLKWKFWEDST